LWHITKKEGYEEYVKKCKLNSVLCIEYYISRGYSIEDAFAMVTKIQVERNSLVSRYSKESLKYLDVLSEYFTSLDKQTLYKNKECLIRLTENEYNISTNRFYFYDFTIPDLNVIIEYHGTYYHDDVDYDKTITMGESDFILNFNKDLYKKWIAEQRGYQVFILRAWEIKSDIINLYKQLQLPDSVLCKLLLTK